MLKNNVQLGWVGLELLYRECMFATMKTKRIVARDDSTQKEEN
jgi:hypothetical protein